MGSFPIQFSLPFCRGESSEEKADCLYYAKIAAFAIGVILLVAGILALSGVFGSLNGEIGWTLAALGIIGLTISCVRCSNNLSTTNSHRNAPIMSSTSQATRHDPPGDPHLNEVTSQPYSTSFTLRRSQPPGKQSAINCVMSDPSSFQNLDYDLRDDEDVIAAAKQSAISWVMSDPDSFQNLGYDLRNDEDVIAAALNGCNSLEQAKGVISNVRYAMRSSKKVALALVRIDPTQFKQLDYYAKNDEDVIVEALNSCKSLEQAKRVISEVGCAERSSKKVALALVRIDPTLLEQLSYDAKNDLDVALLAIKLSTEHTIDKIWSSIAFGAAINEEVRAKVKEKYPTFFQARIFSNTQNTPHQTPHSVAQTRWVEPDDLKDNTSDGANVARRILEQSHLLVIDLTRTDVSKGMAKSILCRLLGLDMKTLDTDLKRAYKKAILHIHPDKLKLQSGEAAFKALNAAYAQADL